MHKGDQPIYNMSTSALATPSTGEKIRSLSECIVYAQSRGFITEYKVLAGGHAADDMKNIYSSADISLISSCNFGGYSDGIGNSILWMIESRNGKKGIIINSYNSFAYTRTLLFINEIKERTAVKTNSFVNRLMNLFF